MVQTGVCMLILL